MSQVFYVPATSIKLAVLHVYDAGEQPDARWASPARAYDYADKANASVGAHAPVNVYRVERHFDGLITATEYGSDDEMTIGVFVAWACFALAVACSAGVWVFL